jgi:hypothetical protein
MNMLIQCSTLIILLHHRLLNLIASLVKVTLAPEGKLVLLEQALTVVLESIIFHLVRVATIVVNDLV